MQQLKQTLCRQWVTQTCRVGLWLVLLGWLGQMGTASANRQRQEAAPSVQTQPVASPPSVAVSPEVQLSQTVSQWLGRQQWLAPERVQVQPLDARVKVQPCAKPLNLDLPFASAQTVRVRCADPVWQLFLQVQLAAPDPRAVAAAAGTPAPGGELRRLVLVAAVPLPRGTMVQAQDLRVQQMSVPASGGAYLENPTDAVHAEVLRDLPAGTPLRRSDLRPSVLVKRGQLVQLSVGLSQGFVVSARVEALQDGRMGEHIKLKNPESGRLLSGVVRGPHMVEGL